MRKRSETVKSEIISVARRLFLSEGYVETTVGMIAAEAGISTRTVYGYFPNKRAILKGVVESAVGDPWEFRIPLGAIETLESLRTALCLIGAGLDEIISRPDYIQLLRVVIAEIPKQPDLGLLFELGAVSRALNSVAGVLYTANALGIISVVDYDAASRQFVGGFVTRIFLNGLLQASSNDLHTLTAEESHEYVDSFLGRAVNRRGYIHKSKIQPLH